MNRIPVWIDCDTGTDDSIALMLAHTLETLDLAGISTVCGNTTQENAFYNTHRINRLMHAAYPVYRGAEAPILRKLETADDFHGKNGLGDVELPLPDTIVFHDEKAWDAIYACARSMPGDLRLVATGPLTNIAIALTLHPDLKNLLHSLLIMGGSATGGNVTPCAEYNIYTDPHAADMVFRSGLKVHMFGLDVTNSAYMTLNDLNELEAWGTDASKFCKACMKNPLQYMYSVGIPGVPMHDSCPVMFLEHPELFRGEEAGVAVETRSRLSNGKTVTDLYSDAQFDFRNAIVYVDVDRETFVQILKDHIKSIA